MIHVHIEVSSVADLQSELSALLGGLSKDTIRDLVKTAPQADVTVSQATPMGAVSDKVEAAMNDEPAFVEDKPAEAYLYDDEPQPTTDEPADGKPADEEPTDDEPADEPQPTMEEARAALNEYRKKKGLPALKALFATHGVKNFLGLPATEYAAIMKEAKEDV